MKKISVIIPCYNVEQYLDRCFQSLISQTLGIENMELIFVNDASTDGTLEKLTTYEKLYPNNVIVINFEENLKQGTARNVALGYASAPYIGYVDSDDWVEPTMYEKLLEAIEKYDCDFVECRWDFAKSANHRKLPKRLGKPGYMDLSNREEKKSFIGSHVALAVVWDKVYKKSFLVDNDIFCPEQIRYEDIFFCYLAFIYAKSYYCVDEVLYHYFVNDEGTVRRKHEEYQFDKMKVTFGFLQTCIERGLMEENKEEIEWLFLEKYYIYMLWEVLEEFPERSYETYLEMQATIREWVPDYKKNYYRNLEYNLFDNTMLKLLDYDLDEQQFMQLKDKLLTSIKTEEAQDF